MRMLCATLAALACGALSASDAFNEDFEKGAGRWHLPSAQWRVEYGAGLDGSKGLVLEYGKGDVPQWIERNEMFPVEPGEAYRIEAWVNDSEFHAKDRPISISFAPYDAHGNYIKGAGTGSKRVIDNIIRKDGFYRVEGTTRPLPANAAKARFYIWAKEGSHGKVRFDGFRAYKVAVNPVEPLVCSAYRDEAAEGEVRFSAGYAVNGLKHDLAKVRAEVRYRSPEGTKTLAATLADGVASAALPVAAFALGTNEVRMVLLEGGKVLGESSCMFARVARLPERKVWIDAHKRTVVDGKPFFPLGMFWGDITAADLAIYTNGAPFNCLMPYRRPDAAKMDLCVAAGVKVIFPIAGWYADFAGTNTQKAAEIDAKYVRGTVEKLRSHPAILAWYLADELIVPYARQLEDRNRMCREVDPDHPTWICQNTTASVRPFVNGYDAIGMDTYPVGNPSGRRDIAVAHGMAAEAVRQMYGARAMWHVPQSFDWSHYAKNQYAAQAKGWKPPPDMRMPTVEEMRSIAWQSVAAGANGLIFYSYMDIMKRGRPEDVQRKQWSDTCAVAREVKEREAVLLSEPGPVPADVPEGVVCRTWKTADGKVHLLACNTTHAAVRGSVRVGGARYGIDLPPIGVKMQELQSPPSTVNAPSGAAECVSGIYPHLAMFNVEGELGR